MVKKKTFLYIIQEEARVSGEVKLKEGSRQEPRVPIDARGDTNPEEVLGIQAPLQASSPLPGVSVSHACVGSDTRHLRCLGILVGSCDERLVSRLWMRRRGKSPIPHRPATPPPITEGFPAPNELIPTLRSVSIRILIT
ncbi:hypothetical protein E2C01_090886 [Portunus trituberculatus]|uniref:Uncharacterized protein n=1 Tax=Portunus trituberculatus TaxID=210409 RepID=A0A5B7JMZ0_PORTR|nr:hypothetical protein [Portunus trituberculatus]